MRLFGGSGLGGFGGGVFALAGIALVVSIILVLVAGRSEDDRVGTRTQARYLGTITLLALFVALFAAFGVVRALTDLIVDKPDQQVQTANIPRELQDLFEQLPAGGGGDGGSGQLPFPIPGLGGEQGSGGRDDVPFDSGRGIGRSDDGDYRAAMRSGLLGLAAFGILWFHLRRARKLVPADKFPGDATGRVARAALYGACTVAAIIALLASARAVYGIFQLIAPGVAGAADADVGRQKGIAQLVSFGILAAGSAFIFLRAWYWLPEHRE